MSWLDAMKLSPADYPERTVGEWRIEHKTIEEGPETQLARLRASLRGGRYVPPGTYVGLFRGRTIVMSDTPDEIRDHVGPYIEVKHRGGRVLIHGLGLGVLLRAVLAQGNVEHVDVVEIDPDVIELVGPAFREAVKAGRLTIHQADAFEKRWPVGTRWSVAWHDVWDVITADNLPEMTRLHRSFGRRADWQGSWCKELIEADRRRYG